MGQDLLLSQKTQRRGTGEEPRLDPQGAGLDNLEAGLRVEGGPDPVRANFRPAGGGPRLDNQSGLIS